MGVIKQPINWVDGGLNYDDDKRLFGPGDSDLRVNVSSDELGRRFVISNMKGTTQKSHSFTHDSTYSGASYTVIGSVYDDNRDAIYICIYSTLSNHCILRYNYSDGTFDKIAWDHTGLGFDIDYPLTDIYMIGDFLHWNPRTTSPRVINVQWAYWDFAAYERTTGVDLNEWNIGEYVSDKNKVYKILITGIIRTEELSDRPDTEVEFIDWSYDDVDSRPNSSTLGEYLNYRNFFNTPIRPFFEIPYTSLESDSSITSNNIRGNIFQFAYRFYVPGQGYTMASSFSGMITNANDESLNGEIVEDITSNNRIDVGFNLYGGLFSREVIHGNWLWEFAEIVFRRNNDSTWRVADRIYHDDKDIILSNTVGAVTTYTIRTEFYNDRTYEVVDSASIEKPYNALPVLAEAQWPLDGERSSYGGVTEGRNYIPPDVTLTQSTNKVNLGYASFPASPDDTINFTLSVYYDPDIGPIYTFKSDAITSLPAAGTSPWTIRFIIWGQDYVGSYTGAVVADYRQAVLNTVNQAGLSAFINASNQIEFTGEYTSPTPVVYLYGAGTISSSTVITKVNSFKTNAIHAFCLYYYDDAHRRSDPMVGVSTSVFIPSIPEDSGVSAGTNHQQQISWQIDYEAPSWAKYWRWGYAGNQSTSLFWQYNVESVAVAAAPLDDYIEINISGLQTITDATAGNDNVHINSKIGAYVFERGDRVRFITQNSGASYDVLVKAAPDYDYEIKDFNAANHKIYIDGTAIGGTPTSYNGNACIIEIYRPNKGKVNLEYYEIGSLNEVYKSSGRYYHRGDVQDQTSSVPATGIHSIGDVYLISRQFANGPFTTTTDPAFVESYSWSDFYDSDVWGKGKLGIISGIGQKYMDNIRFSNRYSPNTLSSGLSEFDALDYKPLSSEYGKIRAMRQAGHVLKVYFERNSASVMVNKTQFLDADGVSQVVKSDQVLGTVEYSNYHYGTIFPESVFLIDRTIYFYDIYRKVYVRDSSNGIFPISEYKAINKFVQISDALLTAGVSNVQVWTGYDPQRRFVYVQVKALNITSVPVMNVSTCVNLNYISFGSATPTGFDAASNGTGIHEAGTVDEIILVAGQEYSVVFDMVLNSGTAPKYDLLESLGGSSVTVEGEQTASAGTNTFKFTARKTTTAALGFKNYSTSTSFDITNIAVKAVPDTVLVFNEKKKRWECTVELTSADLLRSTSRDLISFIDDDLYIHNDNVNRGSFYGASKIVKINIIMNDRPEFTKVLDSLTINSNDGTWVVTAIDIPPTHMYPNGMSSKIPNEVFTKRENGMHAEFLRNMKTSSAVDSLLELREGEELRGQTATLTLENSTTTEVVLFDVLINMSPSKI